MGVFMQIQDQSIIGFGSFSGVKEIQEMFDSQVRRSALMERQIGYLLIG
jgi:hypothetical protein